ncbi:MAG: hypothetical protein K0U66_08170 [Gammaproteobacteria bacterium]|nr:hypothetical protein [Gammaproteobacteria bacterium]
MSNTTSVSKLQNPISNTMHCLLGLIVLVNLFYSPIAHASVPQSSQTIRGSIGAYGPGHSTDSLDLSHGVKWNIYNFDHSNYNYYILRLKINRSNNKIIQSYRIYSRRNNKNFLMANNDFYSIYAYRLYRQIKNSQIPEYLIPIEYISQFDIVLPPYDLCRFRARDNRQSLSMIGDADYIIEWKNKCNFIGVKLKEKYISQGRSAIQYINVGQSGQKNSKEDELVHIPTLCRMPFNLHSIYKQSR